MFDCTNTAWPKFPFPTTLIFLYFSILILVLLTIPLTKPNVSPVARTAYLQAVLWSYSV